MPIYEYRCRNGHTFEVLQSMADDPVSACEECGAPVERVFHPVAVHFKGSGFYTTDYKKKGAAQASGDGETKSESGAKTESTKAEAGGGSQSSSGPKEKPKSSSGG